MDGRGSSRRGARGALTKSWSWRGNPYSSSNPHPSSRVALIAGGAGLAAGLVLGWYIGTKDRKDTLEERAREDESVIDHQALRHGVPSSQSLRSFEGFVACFDRRTRNPDWVLEYLTKERLHGPGDRENASFQEDEGIERRFRNKLEDFRGSGYDRGHLAPAANHRQSHEALQDTFTLTNVSPQVGKGFNRDYWARFEKFVKDLVYRSEEVFVITGPLYLPTRANALGQWRMNHPLIGTIPQLTAVPTHFYKVILTYGGHVGINKYSLGAFVMPNAPIDPNIPLTRFAVRLEDLESVSGLSFFPKLIRDNDKAVVDQTAVVVQQSGQRLLPEPKASSDSSFEAFDLEQREDLQIDHTMDFVVPFKKFEHLCSKHECKLPPKKFWEKKQKKLPDRTKG